MLNHYQKLIATDVLNYLFYNTKGDWNNIHRYKLRLPEEVTKDIFNDELPEVKQYLIDEKYIKRTISYPPSEYYALTDKGKGFVSFEVAERKEKSERYWERFENLPKRLWWVASIFALIVFALPLWLQYCKTPSQTTNQSQQTTDTIQSGKSKAVGN